MAIFICISYPSLLFSIWYWIWPAFGAKMSTKMNRINCNIRNYFQFPFFNLKMFWSFCVTFFVTKDRNSFLRTILISRKQIRDSNFSNTLGFRDILISKCKNCTVKRNRNLKWNFSIIIEKIIFYRIISIIYKKFPNPYWICFFSTEIFQV